MPTQPPILLPNNFLATASGLVVPPGYILRSSAANEVAQKYRHYSSFCGEGFSFGVRLPRDPDTLVIQWAPKGSGLDDLLLAAIADGEIANVGIAPVMWDQLSALILRRQEQVNSVSVVVTGREHPATRALNALARMNDSPLGVIAGVQRILYQLDVFNRGAPLATVSITHPTDQWEQEGMTPVPLYDDKGKATGKYYLEVDWRGRTPTPYLPSVFDLEPTGNQEWPYWYQTLIDGKKSWVLLHQTQIISLLTTQTNRPGIGTSPVWLCLPALAENTLVIDERYEKLIDKPAEGILGISGVTQSADTIRAKIDEPDHTWTLLASPNALTFGGWSFRQADGVDPTKRQQHFEDVLAAAFNEHLSAVVMRTGVGTATASEVAADNVAENGVFAILKAIEIAFGAIYPRVSIRVTKSNDRARRLGLELLGMFAAAVQKLPPDTFTRDELRALIDAEYLTIPVTGGDVTQSDARPGVGAENEEQPQGRRQKAEGPRGLPRQKTEGRRQKTEGSRGLPRQKAEDRGQKTEGRRGLPRQKAEDRRQKTEGSREDEALAVEAAALLVECRDFLQQVIDLTPEQRFRVAIDEARATVNQIQPERWILQLLELARRFANEVGSRK